MYEGNDEQVDAAEARADIAPLRLRVGAWFMAWGRKCHTIEFEQAVSELCSIQGDGVGGRMRDLTAPQMRTALKAFAKWSTIKLLTNPIGLFAFLWIWSRPRR